MNTAMKRISIDETMRGLDWAVIKRRIEIESVNFAKTVFARVVRRFERAGGRGRYSYSLSMQFDFGDGIRNDIPEFFPPTQYTPSGIGWVIEIFVYWNMHITELHGIREGQEI